MAQIITPEMAKLGPDNNFTTYIYIHTYIHTHIYTYVVSMYFLCFLLLVRQYGTQCFLIFIFLIFLFLLLFFVFLIFLLLPCDSVD